MHRISKKQWGQRDYLITEVG